MAKNTVNFQDILEQKVDVCRACMAEEKNMTCLYSNKQLKTYEKLEFCTGIRITQNDGLPTKLCEECLFKLDLSHSFKNTCLETQERLQSALQEYNINVGDIKMEEDDIEEVNQPVVHNDNEITGDPLKIEVDLDEDNHHNDNNYHDEDDSCDDVISCHDDENDSMYFKIVKTIEKGKPKLCVVPSQWESGGVLKWPKIAAVRLSKDQDTIPGSDWLKIKCSVERQNIVSYEKANAELRDMLHNTDNEKVDEEMNSRRPLQRQEPVNLDILSDQLVAQENRENISTSTMSCGNATNFQTEATNIKLSNNAEAQAPATSEKKSDIQNILQNQAILFRVTNEIVDTQKKIINQLASLSVQMEKSFSRIQNLNSVCDTVLLKDASPAESDSSVLKQIKNVEELEQMEQLLSDKEYKSKLQKSCSIICSGGNGNGTNCAYRFLDVLFSRDFLCQCSWSGGSRGDGIKVGLKCFKNTLNFFFEIINYWDCSYTYEANEIFFKNILKNAKKRNSVKYERIPTKRHRSKGKTSVKKLKTPDASNENIETERLSVS